MKIWNTLGEGLGGGLDVQNAVDYHLNAPGLFCSSVCLLCFSAAGLGLLSGAFLLKKRSEFFMFFSSATLPGPAALTIFGL